MRTTKGGKRKARVSVTLDEELVERLKTRADEDDRSVSQYVNRLLRLYLSDMEKNCK